MRAIALAALVTLSGAVFLFPARPVHAEIPIEQARSVRMHQVIGGRESCGAWTTNRRGANTPGGALILETMRASQEAWWIFGYLSGIGSAGVNGADPLGGVDSDGVMAWIDNYCSAHPLEQIYQAADAFYFAHPHP